MAQNEEKIHTSDAQRGDVLVTITYPQGGGSVRATLRVEDRRSGEILVQVDLDPQQFMSAIASGSTQVSGALLPAHPERIGRRMQNTSTNINSRAESAEDEAERVQDEYRADGWEQTHIDRTNFGRRVRAYRWIADEGKCNEPDPCRELAEWLVSLDDPEDVDGREQRRTVTLDQIITRAREALGKTEED